MDVTEFAYEGKIASVAKNGKEADRLHIRAWGIRGDKHTQRGRRYTPRHGEPWQAWWDPSMKETQFFNWRTWIAISAEEREKLALDMGYPYNWIKPGGLWENFAFSGIPSFSKLPPGAHLVIYADAQPVCVLVVHDQNFPCTKTAKHLYDTNGCVGSKAEFGSAFKRHAENLRGVMGYVLWPGGDQAAIVFPGSTVKIWLPVNAHHVY